MKQVLAHIAVFLLPYIIVGLLCLASGLAFNYQQTVTHPTFYGVSMIYWLMLQWPVHACVHGEEFC